MDDNPTSSILGWSPGNPDRPALTREENRPERRPARAPTSATTCRQRRSPTATSGPAGETATTLDYEIGLGRRTRTRMFSAGFPGFGVQDQAIQERPGGRRRPGALEHLGASATNRDHLIHVRRRLMTRRQEALSAESPARAAAPEAIPGRFPRSFARRSVVVLPPRRQLGSTARLAAADGPRPAASFTHPLAF